CRCGSAATWHCCAASPRPSSRRRRRIRPFSTGVHRALRRRCRRHYRALVEATPWADLVRDSGVDEPGIRRLADSYMASKRVIIAWCLGLTQHEHGVDTVCEIVNLLLLRGN